MMLWIYAVVFSMFLITPTVRSLQPATNVTSNPVTDKIGISNVNNINLTNKNVLCINSTKGAAMPDTEDCIAILYQFENRVDYRANRVWVGAGRQAEPDQIPTPFEIRIRTCVIAVTAQDPMRTDVFTLRDLALQVLFVLGNCYPEPGTTIYGGRIPVGHGRTFYAGVFRQMGGPVL